MKDRQRQGRKYHLYLVIGFAQNAGGFPKGKEHYA